VAEIIAEASSDPLEDEDRRHRRSPRYATISHHRL
jgi:hypothetical protein